MFLSLCSFYSWVSFSMVEIVKRTKRKKYYNDECQKNHLVTTIFNQHIIQCDVLFV